MSSARALAESIHPSLWRASQLARGVGRTVSTGYADLDAELPGAGWPSGALVEFLTQRTGVGEMRLLAPALAVSKRPIVLLQPSATPNIAGLAYVGLPAENLLMLTPKSSADALWSAEQILRTGSCGALLFWQSHVRADSLRRLQLAAKSGDTLFFVMRHLAAAADPSPAELRLALRAADGGKVQVEIVKRKGPTCDRTLVIDARPSPILLSRHGRGRRVNGGSELVDIQEKAHA